ncbi:hypothetical protein BGZ82_007601 [Podila clonocystis]|nr:hypothetical protein BGZ82_007601 [Podila clonocystis]
MENGYQCFNSRGNIVMLPLSKDSSGQSYVYWTDIEDCFPGVLRIQDGNTFVPVVRGADGYRSLRAELERQRQNPSSPESLAPSTSMKVSDRQKTKVASPEAASTSASPPTEKATTTTPSSPLAAAIATMSRSSFVVATTAAWPPLFSGLSPVAPNGPTVVSIPVSGFKVSSSLPATTTGALRLKVAVQGSDLPNTAPTTTPDTTARPESGDTRATVTAAEETLAPKAIIPLTDRTIKMPVSSTRRSKMCRFSNSDEHPPLIQKPLSKDMQEDEVDTVANLPSTTADGNETVPESPPPRQELVSATSSNGPRSIGAFPERDLYTPAQERIKTSFPPALAQEGPKSTFSRLFGLFP